MPLQEVIVRAEDLAAARDLGAVAALLRPALAQVRPGAVPAAAVDAAVLYAHALTGTGHAAAASDWAGWAHTRSRHHHGPEHPTTVRALGVLAAALLACGRPRPAAACYRDLTAVLTSVGGAHDVRTLAARADLAAALHRAGFCATAHGELTDAWRTRHGHVGDADDLTIRMLTRLAGMYRDCAEPHLATDHYRQALHLARSHPDPLRQQVQHAATRPPRHDHEAVCTHRPTAHSATPNLYPSS
ncbi:MULTISPECIES: hypothetical protein [Micromonospora]|uniref:hypothetical protein n=1 Tax=Micromonospora TaxID=1873 RepID=UPI0011C13DB4|nr:hypothetical protein [Micromonospora craniellae]QOC94309.1 hypothetical protein ID554_12340 [Micromonospora craniellae]